MSPQPVVQSTSCFVRGGFGDGGSNGAISSSNKSSKNFKWPYLRNRSSDPLHVWLLGGVFGDGGSNGAIFDSNKFKMAATALLDNFEWPYLCNGSRSTYIACIARSSLRWHSFLVYNVIRLMPKNCCFNANVTMTLIKRRKRQKFVYCIFAC